MLGGILLVGTYVLLPRLLESIVAQNLQNGLGLAQRPEVDLEGNPLGVLAGRFEGGHVTLANPNLGGIHPDKVTVDLDPVNINVLGSLTSGRIESNGPLSGDLEADLSREEVARIATSTGVVNGVDLEEGRLVVDFAAGDFGARAPVGVEGNLVLQGGALRFEPGRAQVLGVPVPQQLLQRADFSYPLSELPFDGALSSAEVHKDHIILSGQVKNLPLG